MFLWVWGSTDSTPPIQETVPLRPQHRRCLARLLWYNLTTGSMGMGTPPLHAPTTLYPVSTFAIAFHPCVFCIRGVSWGKQSKPMEPANLPLRAREPSSITTQHIPTCAPAHQCYLRRGPCFSAFFRGETTPYRYPFNPYFIRPFTTGLCTWFHVEGSCSGPIWKPIRYRPSHNDCFQRLRSKVAWHR